MMVGFYYFTALILVGFANSEKSFEKFVPPIGQLSFSKPSPNSEEGRIVNGIPAVANQFPYQVSVRLFRGTSGFICGGSIISASFVLTAGHCADGVDRFEVGFGSIQLNSPQFTVATTVKIVHPRFDSTTLNNDLALIGLPKPITFSKSVQPILLASSRDSCSCTTYVDETVTVSGFGRISDQTQSVSNFLNFVQLRVISNPECVESFGPTVTQNFICCVGKNAANQNTCNGDSGGPLTTLENGVPVQIGIVSFVALKGCEAGLPSGFTRVANYLPWIKDQTGIAIRA